MHVLGINAYHGNASAALFCDGQLVAAAEEERFNRVKYAAGFPIRAIRYCLAEAGVGVHEVDHIAIPRDPWARLGRKALYALRLPRMAFERSKVLVRFAGIREELARGLDVDPARVTARFHRVEHHLAHLASAFLVSPFEHAAVLSADGLGDFASTMWGMGRDRRMLVLGVISFPHSLGLYYSALTQYLGFWKYGDEYKVMGLAAYGEPVHRGEFRRILRSGDGSRFRLALEFFRHHREGAPMTWRESDQTPEMGPLFGPRLEALLGPARRPREPLEQCHKDVAATLQARLEEVLFELLNELHRKTGRTALCLAGGVAFNCVANGKIFEHTPFRDLYVQPAAGDAGLAVGAAAQVYHQVLGQPRQFAMRHAYWGPSFSNEEIRRALERRHLPFRELPEEALCRETARHIAAGRIVGWFQGRMEWGPRALGNRSIVVDPRRPEMKDLLNRRVKHRESFRPFAPSVLEEATADYFERTYPSPFMNLAYAVRPAKRDVIPAATHVDGTGRLQTVSVETNPQYWRLIEAFQRETGVPVLLNTSFNDNEPIVCTPEDALSCFSRTKLDVLVLGNYLLTRDGAA
ncbi:MAG: carbamoyltransferase [Gemmatimonadetes bacterium]|nr:carbamoyltransferase [Gemmatimonadota bacterium]